MRILYCVNSLGARGGIERVTIVKANALADIEGNEVAICYTDKGDYPRTIHPLSPKVQVFDLNTPYWQFTTSLKILKSFIPTVIATRRALKRLIRSFRPDVVVSTGSYEKFALASLSVINKIGGGNVSYVREFHFASTYRRYIGSSRVAVSVCEFLDNQLLGRCFNMNYLLTKQDLEKNFKSRKNFDYMYNPCSFNCKHETISREKIVLAVGRLVYQKNFAELLEIWSMIQNKAYGWKLRVVGSGSLENELKEKALQLGILDTVEFPGFSSNVDAEMAKASVYVMTSICEGFGLVLVEAQNAGLPCVSYDLPYGPSEIIHDGEDGFIVENSNKKFFADKLLRLIQDADLRDRMGMMAQDNSKRFSTEIIANQWMKKYNTLLEYK